MDDNLFSTYLWTSWEKAGLVVLDGAERVVDNTPMLLMRDGVMIDAALRRCRVTHSDVVAKLREANALDLGDVHAVVLETTGDISVLHGDGPIDDLLLDGVRDLRSGS